MIIDSHNILPVGNPVEFFVFVIIPGILFQVMAKLFKPNPISEWGWYKKLDELSVFGNKTAGELLDKLLVVSLIGAILNIIGGILLIFLPFIVLAIIIIFIPVDLSSKRKTTLRRKTIIFVVLSCINLYPVYFLV